MDPLWLSADVPRLYHAADEGAWSSIQALGLLSTSALLDRYGIDGEQRWALESEHRPKPVTLRRDGLPTVVLRDQGPLKMPMLSLDGGMTAEQWIRLLNGKVFFWASENRLKTFLSAPAHANRFHDVLVVNTRALVECHKHRIKLSRINSGATRSVAARRGPMTFLSIAMYPDSPGERKKIAEVTVDDAVPDVSDFVLRVERRQGPSIVSEI